MLIRKYQASDEKGWVYTKALSYLFSPFFDDREREKPPLNQGIYDHRVEWVAEEDGEIIGLLDIDIYNEEYSQFYLYAPANRVAYFTNLAVHPDYQGRGIAQALYQKAYEELQEHQVEKLAIFTRQGDVANHLYRKWGGQLVCCDYLVVGCPKTTPDFSFGVDLNHASLSLKDVAGNPIPYYLREGIYIVADKADIGLFDYEEYYQEMTYIIDIRSS